MTSNVCIITCPHCKMECFDPPSNIECLYVYECEYCGRKNEVIKNELCLFIK